MNAIDPFRIDIADTVLGDLAARLERSRLPSPPIPGGGEAAETIRRIEELIAYWRDGYDWRAQERRLNAVPQYRATVDGAGIHVLHIPGSGPDPLPLLLTNGWPSSFVEYLAVIGPLTDPTAHGGDPADSFTVVIPALPGYGFSDKCLDRQLTRVSIAALFNQLMTGHLGYRYEDRGITNNQVDFSDLTWYPSLAKRGGCTTIQTDGSCQTTTTLKRSHRRPCSFAAGRLFGAAHRQAPHFVRFGAILRRQRPHPHLSTEPAALQGAGHLQAQTMARHLRNRECARESR